MKTLLALILSLAGAFSLPAQVISEVKQPKPGKYVGTLIFKRLSEDGRAVSSAVRILGRVAGGALNVTVPPIYDGSVYAKDVRYFISLPDSTFDDTVQVSPSLPDGSPGDPEQGTFLAKGNQLTVSVGTGADNRPITRFVLTWVGKL